MHPRNDMRNRLLLAVLTLTSLRAKQTCNRSLYYNHPTVFDEHSRIQPASIGELSEDGTYSTVVSNLDNPSGIALDVVGNLYYGNIRRDPLQFELYRLTREGTITDLGDVLYTRGSVSAFWSFDVQYHNPRHFYCSAWEGLC